MEYMCTRAHTDTVISSASCLLKIYDKQDAEEIKAISYTTGLPAGESLRLVLCLSQHLCPQIIAVTKHIQWIIENEHWVMCSMLFLCCPLC